MIKFERFTLENGLRVLFHKEPTTPMAVVNVLYDVGARDEDPQQTGFAHLFEHLMFMGSRHAPYPQFDRLLEAAGASNNGSTTTDRTNYYESGPANSLPLMLWLEADRLGWMLETMDSAKVDLQRDVVKNERRQSYENQPYGLAFEALASAIYPAGHPYSWTTIGSMADLSAASLEDVKSFFRTYYAPNNATLVVAGDVRADSVRTMVRTMFAEIPRGPAFTRPRVTPFAIRDTVITLEDRVQLPRLYLAWHGVREFHADDAALDLASYILAGARNSRLTKALVQDRPLALVREQAIASEANAFTFDLHKGSDLLVIDVVARPGVAPEAIEAVVVAEVERLIADGVTAEERGRALALLETGWIAGLQSAGARADKLSQFATYRGDAALVNAEPERHAAVTVEALVAFARTWLVESNRATLLYVPQPTPAAEAA